MPAVGCRKGHKQESRQPPQPLAREEQLPHDNNALGTHLLHTIADLAKQVQTIHNQHREIDQRIGQIDRTQIENFVKYDRHTQDQNDRIQTMDHGIKKMKSDIKGLMNDKYERLDHEVFLEWEKTQKNIVKEAPNDRNKLEPPKPPPPPPPPPHGSTQPAHAQPYFMSQNDRNHTRESSKKGQEQPTKKRENQSNDKDRIRQPRKKNDLDELNGKYSGVVDALKNNKRFQEQRDKFGKQIKNRYTV